VYGLRRGLEFLDRETGLPQQPIAGCVVDNTIIGRAAGHNGRIKEFIAERGLPGNSFKRWEKELFDLKGYYGRRKKTERPIHLAFGGPVAKSPDGKYTLRLVTTPREQPKGEPLHVALDRLEAKSPEAKAMLRFVTTPPEESEGKPRYYPAIVITAGGVDHKPVMLLQEGQMDCFWGPAESGFAVIRCRWEETLIFTAVDLRRGRVLREETTRLK
jgi:hypothetical protein